MSNLQSNFPSEQMTHGVNGRGDEEWPSLDLQVRQTRDKIDHHGRPGVPCGWLAQGETEQSLEERDGHEHRVLVLVDGRQVVSGPGGQAAEDHF